MIQKVEAMKETVSDEKAGSGNIIEMSSLIAIVDAKGHWNPKNRISGNEFEDPSKISMCGERSMADESKLLYEYELSR
jgi:hypothetical protein